MFVRRKDLFLRREDLFVRMKRTCSCAAPPTSTSHHADHVGAAAGGRRGDLEGMRKNCWRTEGLFVRRIFQTNNCSCGGVVPAGEGLVRAEESFPRRNFMSVT